MVKYVKTLPGPPYVNNCPLTKGFTPGVGYFKNILAVYPVWAACIVMTVFSGAGIALYSYKQNKLHPDFHEMCYEAYKVRRVEDVDDPTRECYN